MKSKEIIYNEHDAKTAIHDLFMGFIIQNQLKVEYVDGDVFNKAKSYVESTRMYIDLCKKSDLDIWLEFDFKILVINYNKWKRM